jgi:excisionase family DNA binding protein
VAGKRDVNCQKTVTGGPFPDRRVNPDRRRSVVSATKGVLNTREACTYLRISRPTFHKLIASGKIRAQKSVKDGKCWKPSWSVIFRQNE